MNYKYLILFIVIIIILIISIAIKNDKNNTHINKNKNKKIILLDTKKELPKNKPILWFYWEDINNKKKPAYIDICIDSIYKYCSSTFNIIHLNNLNIDDYLPEIKYNQMDLTQLNIAHRVDFYRILLMYKYGGIYIDADILVLKDLKSIHDKLENYDYVGFGCTGNFCKIGNGKPSNWIICSRPNTKLMMNILQHFYDKFNQINGGINGDINSGYHDFGKLLIWEELDNLIKNENYEYYHYPNLYDGTRDINGTWVSLDRLFSNENIIYDKPNDLMFIVLYNSDATEEMKKISKENLLKSSYFISKYFKQIYQ